MEEQKIDRAIEALVGYGVEHGLIDHADRIYTRNRILALLKKEEFTDPEPEETVSSLPEILDILTDYADEKGLLQSSGITGRDLFDTELMGLLTPRPSEVHRNFRDLYRESPEEATDYFYTLAQDSNYIRTDRVARDRKWSVESPYGDIDISINLSKPEKDPRDIAAARKVKQTAYPACQLCPENEGYAGRLSHPARANHRIIPISIAGQEWGFQYSPYVYYNEHCIVLNQEHVPMKIDREAFRKLFDFVRQFPHYFVGSNADLPIVGGSILTHEHFQGGRYEFAMAKAPFENTFTVPEYEDVEAGILHWPLSVIRLRGEDPERLIDLADHILNAWRSYSDPEAQVFAETNGEPHNTITPIARKKGKDYELDLALRNNLTTEEYPLGLYHPHPEYHHIKRENIGLIEVMGLAILPARLEKELSVLADALVHDGDLNEEAIRSHKTWAEELKNSYTFTEENVHGILEQEVGKIFVGVLEDAGVYKCTPEGRDAFFRFVETL